MKLAEKIAWFRRDFVAILPVERATCDTFEASTQTGARGGSRTDMRKNSRRILSVFTVLVSDCIY
jgi:hypothetical protein